MTRPAPFGLIWAALALTLSTAVPAFAQEKPVDAVKDAAKDAAQTTKDAAKTVNDDVVNGGTFSIQIENDKINKTDRHYTNGFRMGWVSDRSDTGPEWLRDTLDALYPFSSLKGSRIGFTLGQTMYTPSDTNRRDLIRDDRPYAGWLFAGASLHGEGLQQPTIFGTADTLDTIELTIGIVGPHAYGEQVQNNFHDLIGVDHAYGWNNQLRDEATVNMMVERRWRTSPFRALGLEADAVPTVGASVGNVFIYGGAGTILRLGQDLAMDYGPSHIQPSLSGPELMNLHKGLSWYFFAGTEGRAIGRNLFLDGNTFRDSPTSVDKKNFVADFQAGLAIAYGAARLSFAQVWRTKEFEGQDGHDEFGAINLSWHF